MIRLLLGVSMLIVCTLIGKQKALKLKNGYLYFSSLRAFCKNYESNLIYGKKEIKTFINEEYSSTYFTSTLKSFIENDKLNLPDFLSSKESSDVSEFFNFLGVSDSASQLITVKSFYNTFLEYEKDKNESYKKSYSAYLKIGFSIGLMLLLVVI